MSGLALLLMDLIEIYVWIVIAGAVLSWLVAFKVVDPQNQVVSTIGRVLYALTEPVLAPIRRFLPAMGGIDLSPVVLIFGLFILQRVVFSIAI